MSKHCNCHDHDHQHDHHDHHHRGHEAEAFVESALRKSGRRELVFSAPVSAKAFAAGKLAVLSEIAERIAFEDVILGHIKALLDFGERRVPISITRLDECDQTFDCLDGFKVMNCVITVNVLSLHNTDTELDDLFEKLFEK